MGKTALTVNVRIDGARETLAAFRQMGKDAEGKLRDAAQSIADSLAASAQAAARAEGGQAALMAPTVKAIRDRVPVVQVGGTRRVGRRRAPAYGLLFGSEFGMNRRSGWYAASRYRSSIGAQFKPHRGIRGYWFFPLVESEQDRIAAAWTRAADELVREFGRGGDA